MIVLLQADQYSGISNQLTGLTKVEEIYKQCFDKYFERLYHYAFTIVRDDAEAKDIVQSAFVKLWERRKEVNLATSAQSYLYTSVYRLSLNTIRNRKIREGHHKKIIPIQEKEEKISVEEKERRIRIESAIHDLPPKCKEVFLKSRMEGKKYSIIAIELDISIKTVEAQIGKALKILRERLADLIIAFLTYIIIH